MMKMLSYNPDLSEFIPLEIEINAKFRFKRNPDSRNFGLIYYSDEYSSGKSLGTVDEKQVKNNTYRNQIQKTIENLFDTSGGERDFIKRCKSIYGKRLRTETYTEKLTLDELEQVEKLVKELREED